jgi:hypothetical protein
LYAELVKMLEAITPEEWMDPEMERRIWDLDDALSKILKARNITHYAIPFKDRPEIAILSKGMEMNLITATLQVVDEH